MKRSQKTSHQEALEIFQSRGGILRTSEAIRAGIHPRTLYELNSQGEIERIDRGLYGITGLPDIQDPDLVTVTKKVSRGVICLISALYFHQLTSQIPHCVHVALPQHIKAPTISHLPVRFYWFSKKSWEAGIEEFLIGGTTVRCYCVEKTISDCFKHRNKIGVEVAIEALKNYWKRGKPKLNKIYEYAKLSKVNKIIQPYLDTVINEQS